MAKAVRQVEAKYVEFFVKGAKIQRVNVFKYLGIILSEDDNDTKVITVLSCNCANCVIILSEILGNITEKLGKATEISP